MFGLLNINKPQGVTSRDVVNRVQRIVRPVKVGHAGTLDPLAEGVLVVCVGQATRLIQYVQQMKKHYIGAFLLGRQSDTEDVEGRIEELPAAREPSREQIEVALQRFVGEIEQRPPAFSALKVAGRRAYDLARQGQTVELKARKITIYGLKLLSYDYPELQLDIECGSGTYVRSLGRDVAESLGTAAVMSALVRTAVGTYCLDQACDLDGMDDSTIAELLLPPEGAVAALPSMKLTDQEQRRIVDGRFIDNRGRWRGDIAALDESGELVAILHPHRQQRLKPRRVFKTV